MNEKIAIGKEINRNLPEMVDDISPHKTVIITDSRVKDLWLDEILSRIEAESLVIPEGETNKSLENVKKIWNQLLEMDFTRKSLIIAMGGGMITDISAFISSTFKRGTHLGLIPTTLLSQVDAAIGGKTGINFNGKNMIGTFYEPDFVLIDTHFLETLPREEVKNGLGEVLKYALLSSEIYELVQESKKVNDENILEIITSYLNKQEDIVAVYLFGSTIKDCARKDSDLDLAVLFREDMDAFYRFDQKLQLTNELEELVQLKVDLVDLRSADDYFIHQVMKNKLLLIEKNTSARVNFEVNHRKRYFDRMYFYRQYRLQAIKRLKERNVDGR